MQHRTTENDDIFDMKMSFHFDHIKLSAPAKLNLMLHITGRREDGYHNLQTLFHFLDFCDDLSFTTRPDGEIVLLPSLQGVDDSQNLILRAARLLQDESGTELGATIRMMKRIPMGGGFGGGSSDAATTIIGLNELWRTRFSKDHLQKIGGTLGADVPIFIFGHSAWAEGTGDQLTPVEIPEYWYLVITPPCHVSTAEVFTHEELVRNTPVTSLADVLAHGGRNDCQSLVRKLYPEVHKSLLWLGRFAKAQMTGTGSAVFAEFHSFAEAQEVLTQLPSDMVGFVSRGLNVSPLYQTGKISSLITK